MLYYVFDTREAADAANRAIWLRYRDVLTDWFELDPADNTADGPVLGWSLATEESVPGALIGPGWATPRQRLDGKWVFPKPTSIALGDFEAPDGGDPLAWLLADVPAEIVGEFEQPSWWLVPDQPVGAP